MVNGALAAVPRWDLRISVNPPRRRYLAVSYAQVVDGYNHIARYIPLPG
jgi:hypothetical protein